MNLFVGENMFLRCNTATVICSSAHINKTLEQALSLVFFHLFNPLANNPSVFHVQLKKKKHVSIPCITFSLLQNPEYKIINILQLLIIKP